MDTELGQLLGWTLGWHVGTQLAQVCNLRQESTEQVGQLILGALHVRVTVNERPQITAIVLPSTSRDLRITSYDCLKALLGVTRAGPQCGGRSV